MSLTVTGLEQVERSTQSELLEDLLSAVDEIGKAIREPAGRCIICGREPGECHDTDLPCGRLARAFVALEEAAR